jgi:hypothetical protein
MTLKRALDGRKKAQKAQERALKPFYLLTYKVNINSALRTLPVFNFCAFCASLRPILFPFLG